MGPVAVRVRRLAASALIGLVAAACQGSTEPEVVDADRSFPLPAETDLVVRLAPGASRPEVRRMTTDLVLSDGVEATEAHYDTDEVRVVVSRDMSTENRERLRSRILEYPEAVDVELEPPEE